MRFILKLILLSFITCFLLVSNNKAQTNENFEVNGVKIHYTIEGKGEPVILIHGLYSSAALNWKIPGLSNILSKDYQVIALDLPGHGQSDKPQNQEAYGTQMVEDVVELLDHLNIKKAHIVGYSMGGMITVKLLVTHPDRVSSAVVGGMGWLREGSFLQKIWERLPGNEHGNTPNACVHSFGKLAITQQELKQINIPVIVMVGDRDPVKRLYVLPLEELRKDWQVIEIQGAGHLDCIIKPQFKEEVKKWLDRQKTSN